MKTAPLGVPTPDQESYLRDLAERSTGFDPTVVVGGPANSWTRIAEQNPPLKWLVEQLRGMAKDQVASGVWIGERDPARHICWLAAELIEQAAIHCLTRPRGGGKEEVMVDHSNPFHEALHKVRDIAKNGTRNTQAWNDVIEVADAALDEARRIDRATNSALGSPVAKPPPAHRPRPARRLQMNYAAAISIALLILLPFLLVLAGGLR